MKLYTSYITYPYSMLVTSTTIFYIHTTHILCTVTGYTNGSYCTAETNNELYYQTN